MNESMARCAVQIEDEPAFSRMEEAKAWSVGQVERLVEGGFPVDEAVGRVAHRMGFGKRTLYTFLERTDGVPKDEWEAALARRSAPPRPKTACHPDALKVLVEGYRRGAPFSLCYRMMKAEAAANGWEPIPSESSMRRELQSQMSREERWKARRAPKTQGEV